LIRNECHEDGDNTFFLKTFDGKKGDRPQEDILIKELDSPKK
jgi:hypothetical protein